MGWKKKKTTFHSRRSKGVLVKREVKTGADGTRFTLKTNLVWSLPLSGRPGHRSAAEKVDVDVVHGLTAVFSGVDDSAIALRESLGARDFRSSPMQVAEQGVVFPLCVRDGCDVFARDDKDVHRRLWLDVGEGVTVLILVDGFGGNTSVDDLAEYATHGEESTGVRIRLSAHAGTPAVFSVFDLEIESALYRGILGGGEEAMDGLSKFAIESSNAGERYLDQPVFA
jgi:hypothetical protein